MYIHLQYILIGHSWIHVGFSAATIVSRSSLLLHSIFLIFEIVHDAPQFLSTHWRAVSRLDHYLPIKFGFCSLFSGSFATYLINNRGGFGTRSWRARAPNPLLQFSPQARRTAFPLPLAAPRFCITCSLASSHQFVWLFQSLYLETSAKHWHGH